MEITSFSAHYLDDLTQSAKTNSRLRQHHNIHRNYQEPCQRLFNAIEPKSYIQPHRHATDPRDELLIAIRGLMALVIFDEQGQITNVLRFGSEKYGSEISAGAEIPSNTWHTLIALQKGCILLEVKAGPFNPDQPKELAPWAPQEGSREAEAYLNYLLQTINP